MNQFGDLKIYKSKRKTISLQINEDATLIVRAPLTVSDKRIVEIINKKSDWILDKKKILKEKAKKILKIEFKENEKIPFLGNYYTLKLTESKNILLTEKNIQIPKDFIRKNPKKKLEIWAKKCLQTLIEYKLSHFSQKTNLKYSSFKITSAKKRLGSCTSKNSLNFSWKISFFPEEIIDYVVIHEICHIKIKNHSKNFWKEVEKYCPDYLERKKWIKENCYKFMNY